MEYHLRLQQQKRAVLDPVEERSSIHVGGGSLAGRLFECATVHGARSLGVDGGELRAGTPADFFTVDLKDVSIAGAEAAELLPMIVFGMNRSAIRDVAVDGRFIVRDRRHVLQDEIVERYEELHAKVWRDGSVDPRATR